jgi:hypothetical protein
MSDDFVGLLMVERVFDLEVGDCERCLMYFVVRQMFPIYSGSS